MTERRPRHALLRLLGYARSYRIRIVLAALFSILNEAVDLAPPALTGAAVDIVMDNKTETAIQRSLERSIANRATSVIAHPLSTIRNADRIFVLDGGVLKEQSRHEDLIRCGSIYAAPWRVQTGERLPAAAD